MKSPAWVAVTNARTSRRCSSRATGRRRGEWIRAWARHTSCLALGALRFRTLATFG